MKRARHFLCLASAFAAYMLLLSSVPSASDVQATSVCEVSEQASRFEGRLVSLFARIESSYHFTTLVDDNCPKAGLSLRVRSGKLHGEMERLDKNLPSIFNRKRVKGRFVGRVGFYPGDQENPFNDLPYWFLEVVDVSELLIEEGE